MSNDNRERRLPSHLKSFILAQVCQIGEVSTQDSPIESNPSEGADMAEGGCASEQLFDHSAHAELLNEVEISGHQLPITSTPNVQTTKTHKTEKKRQEKGARPKDKVKSKSSDNDEIKRSIKL